MKKQKTNWVLTIVLILGTLTVFFPLYMAVIIAFKKPSEMTNDVAGALSFPSKWSFSNFTEAMKVTDFWHSLGNSLLITIVTIVLAILIHSIAGYVIGRGMARKKSFRFIYLYIGFIIGNTTLQYVVHVLAPSMSAASSSAIGIFFKYPLYNNTFIGM